MTVLSSAQLNKYGCLGLTITPLIVEICPVYVIFKFPVAKSQNFIVLSEDPVTKN